MPLIEDPSAHAGLLDSHDAFTDNPVPFLVETLLDRFPDAKFVLTHRPVEQWLRSMQWLFEVGVPRLDPTTRKIGEEVHQQLYGTVVFDADLLAAIHAQHHQRVSSLFAANPEQLLRIGTNELAWPPLCSFLGRRRPWRRFPVANRRA